VINDSYDRSLSRWHCRQRAHQRRQYGDYLRGGDTNNANNSFSDPTSIAVPLVDLSPSMALLRLRQTGVNFNIQIQSGTLLRTDRDRGSAHYRTTPRLSGTGWNCTLNNSPAPARMPLVPPINFSTPGYGCRQERATTGAERGRIRAEMEMRRTINSSL
jgi:hypothetical protein